MYTASLEPRATKWYCEYLGAAGVTRLGICPFNQSRVQWHANVTVQPVRQCISEHGKKKTKAKKKELQTHTQVWQFHYSRTDTATLFSINPKRRIVWIKISDPSFALPLTTVFPVISPYFLISLRETVEGEMRSSCCFAAIPTSKKCGVILPQPSHNAAIASRRHAL